MIFYKTLIACSKSLEIKYQLPDIYKDQSKAKDYRFQNHNKISKLLAIEKPRFNPIFKHRSRSKRSRYKIGNQSSSVIKHRSISIQNCDL